jgi:hypothetical protein
MTARPRQRRKTRPECPELDPVFNYGPIVKTAAPDRVAAIKQRLKELAAIAKRDALFSPAGLRRWNAASAGGARKRGT